MPSQGRDDRGYAQGPGRGPWQGDRRPDQRDEDDYPEDLHGGSREGGYSQQSEPQSTGRRDYGGGPRGGYPEGGYGAGGYGQQSGEGPGRPGGQPGYSAAGYGGGEPTHMGYGHQEQQARSGRQDYGPGQGQQAYLSYGGQSGYRPQQHESYGQGPEPASGAFGGAGLGGYSEGSSDIGRGLASSFGYGEQAAYREAGYGRPQQGGTAQGRGGGFRGRGPKGYQRSDERINEEVCQRLCDDDDLDASEIEVAVAGGEVTLTGAVPDRPSKRHAEDLAESVSGVQHVQNNLRLRVPRSP